MSADDELLRGAECAACDGAVDEHAHAGVYVSNTGKAFPHLTCTHCFGNRSRAELAAAVELKFMPAKGSA